MYDTSCKFPAIDLMLNAAKEGRRKGGKEEGLEVVDQTSMKKVQWCERTGRRGRAGGAAALMRIARAGGAQCGTKRGDARCLLPFF